MFLPQSDALARRHISALGSELVPFGGGWCSMCLARSLGDNFEFATLLGKGASSVRQNMDSTRFRRTEIDHRVIACQ